MAGECLKLGGNPFNQWGNLPKKRRGDKDIVGIGEWIKAMGESKKIRGECFRRMCYQGVSSLTCSTWSQFNSSSLVLNSSYTYSERNSLRKFFIKIDPIGQKENHYLFYRPVYKTSQTGP